MEEKVGVLVLHFVVEGGSVNGEIRRALRLQMLLENLLPNVFIGHKNFGQLMPRRRHMFSELLFNSVRTKA